MSNVIKLPTKTKTSWTRMEALQDCNFRGLWFLIDLQDLTPSMINNLRIGLFIPKGAGLPYNLSEHHFGKIYFEEAE